MELEELKKKCTELSAELNRVTAEIERIEKGQQGRWKPEKYDEYWCIEGSGRVANNIYQNGDYNTGCYKIHNCFKTKEEAQARTDKIKIYWRLYDLAERLNKGEKIDWKNPNQTKYYITAYIKGLFTTLTYCVEGIGEIYCLDSQFLDKALEEIRRR